MIIIPNQLKDQKFIKTREKIPIEEAWTTKNNYHLSDIAFQEYIKNSSTYGVLCGINNLLVIDMDNEDIQIDAENSIDCLKNTFIVKSAGKGLKHYYFYCDKKPESFKCLDKDNNTLLDAQGEGKQIIGAGSVLANGRVYEVINDVDILKIDYDDLRSRLIKYNFDNKNKGDKAINIDPLNEKIRDKITIPKLLIEEGINTKKNPTECPFHSSKGGKCLSFTDSLFHCFHCGKEGDIFNLIMELKNCNFIEAKKYLIDLAGLAKQSGDKKDNLSEYKELDIKKYVIYKSKDETIYKIYISNFYITLIPDMILGSAEFRKKYFNETGHLLGKITTEDWVALINGWVGAYGQIIDHTKDTNSDAITVERVISDIQSFAVVTDPSEAVSYGRVYFNKEDKDFVYVCNKALDSILKKNQLKITLSKLKVLIDEYIDGNSKVIRTGKRVNRFFRFKVDKLEDLDISDVVINESS